MKLLGLLFSLVIVSFTNVAFAQEEPPSIQEHTMLKTTQDGTINVQISSNLPKENAPLIINLKFSDAKTKNDLPNVNYDIIAMQNGEVVLSQLGLYTVSGSAQHTTIPLSTDDQVDVIVILQGIGESAPYAGPKGETIETLIVPEFGIITPVILMAAISMIIVVQKTIQTSRSYF